MIARDNNSIKGNRKNYLEKAKANFKWICMVCGKEKTNHSFDLIVHHIDRNKFNNHLSNLKVLCQSCHAKEHYEDMNTKEKRDKTSLLMKKRWFDYRESKKKVCPTCKKNFYAVKGKKIFCSRECNLKKLNNLEGKPHWNKGKQAWNKGLKSKK